MNRALAWHLGGALAVAALAAALYLPFLGNPLVFDDRIFFSGQLFAHYATHPLGLDLRLPAHFSLVATEVLAGGVAVHRSVSLVLHVACAIALYRLLVVMLRSAAPQRGEAEAALCAAVVAGAFALHPVAVYGAAYLVQRSIVLATLFSLLSWSLFLRGLQRGRHADALSAALLFSLAVLSKEHAVLLPAAVLPAMALAAAPRRFALKHAAIYLAACAPAGIFVVLRSLGIIGGAYEDAFGAIAAQIEDTSGVDVASQPLLMSAVTQAGLFYKYLALWLWPDPGGMSIDLRVDFVGTWSPAWIAAKVLAFAGFGALGVALLARRGLAAMAGGGMLYAWVLFLVEFSAARFQEPFVLYRSYLWAPGIGSAVAAGLALVPRRGAIAAAGLAAGVILAVAAHDRLTTFSSPLRLWEDAVAKLPEKPVPYGSRTLYGLGREYLYSGMPAKAVDVTERCIAQYPRTPQCYYARGAVHLHLKQFEPARSYLARTLEFQPRSGIVHHRLGLALECLGRIEEATASYRSAEKFGYRGAQFELQRLERAPRATAGDERKPPACR
jgi:tetratricopeptide (TPR) repeat protein